MEENSINAHIGAGIRARITSANSFRSHGQNAVAD
jgi:hypothetical protein